MQGNKQNWKMRRLNKASLHSQNEVYLTGLSAVENSETSERRPTGRFPACYG